MSDHTVPEIPELLAAAWGVRARPSKGPRPGLSVREVVRAAIRVAAEEGLAAVTMNRVAAELGTVAMSLYRYVSSKDELLVLMMDGASGPPPDHLWQPADDWRSALARWGRTLRAVYLDNPWLTQLPITSPPATPNQVAWMECALRAMSSTNLREGDKVSTLLLLSGWVRAEAALQVGLFAGRSSAAETNLPFGFDYGRVLAVLTDPGRFRAVRAVLDAGVFDSPEEGDKERTEDAAEDGSYDFEFGLQRILDGVQLMMANGESSSRTEN